MLGYVTTQPVLLHQLAQKHYHSDPALRVVLLIKLSHCQETAVDLTDQNIITNTIYQKQQHFIITALSNAEWAASSITMQLQHSSFHSERSANNKCSYGET
jgi:hypothetical protein